MVVGSGVVTGSGVVVVVMGSGVGAGMHWPISVEALEAVVSPAGHGVQEPAFVLVCVSHGSATYSPIGQGLH